ncbi:hypothetical protein AB1Y20_006534 [Prymnesium parvum]|uniref:Glycoside hydrolase family 5 domain-containing protein n=1 Tax=Prymnesium parvum TaxID=97485 RepID=A0AB34IYN5_PRYPA
MRHHVPLLALSLAAAARAAALPPVAKIHVCGRWFCDPLGRVRIFHGFNDVGEAKQSGAFDGFNYLPKLMRDPALVSQLHEWGFNVMRLPMMWAALQPSDGALSTAYLAAMRNITQELAAHGLFSFLDMHQDVLSSKLGSYDGAPQWVVNRTTPRHAYPWPLTLPLKQWGLGYLAEATGQSFQEIYHNTHGGRDAWAAAWRGVAAHFRGDAAILGYELINEPFAGDIYADPTLLLPGVAGRKNLMPAYDAVAAAIRAVDDATIVLFEPVTWGMILPTAAGALPKLGGSGFDRPPGGRAYANRSAFAFHYYCWFATGISEQKPSSAAYPPLEKAECDRVFGPLVFDAVDATVEYIGGASIMTEFGAMVPNASSPSSLGTLEMEWVLNEADRRFQSWTYWDIGALFSAAPSGAHAPRMEALLPFIRPFARAIAGTPVGTSLDYRSARFTLAFRVAADLLAPTEIFLPSLRYPRGYSVTVAPASSLQCGACPNETGASPKLAHDLLCCLASPGFVGVANVTVVPRPTHT